MTRLPPSLAETLPPGLSARLAGDADAPGLVALVGGCYAEYPGCVLDPAGVDADLHHPGSQFSAKGGELALVFDTGGHLAACVGWAPGWLHPGSWELKRLYVAAAARRRGLGAALVAATERAAAQAGIGTVELWSDTRFTDAHRLYTRLGYSPQPIRRALGDPSRTTERLFVRALPAPEAH